MHAAAFVILTLALIVVGVSTSGVIAEQGGAGHNHIGHVADAWNDTPDGQGLLPAALAEARIAAQHAGLAARDTSDLDAMKHIVFYSANVRPWKDRMVVAASATRKEAIKFIDEAAVVGGTATYDALKVAFELADKAKVSARKRKRKAPPSVPDPSGDAKVDTIILLSDGKPSVGGIIDPVAIRDAIRAINRVRQIAIHTVAFGADADRAFMRGLAEDSNGKFVAK